MNLIGKIKDIGRALDGKYTLTIESPQIAADEAKRLLQEERLDVEIKKHRKKRSLDANSYYWLLLSRHKKIAHIQNTIWEIYKTFLKNHDMAEYNDRWTELMLQYRNREGKQIDSLP